MTGRRRNGGRRAADGAWKRVLTDLLPEFLAFAVPDLYRETDWATAPIFLDNEIQAIARQAAVGSRLAGLIVQLRLRSGTTTWLVLHVEVRGQSEPDFAARMFTYYALIHLRLWRQRRRKAAREQGELPLILGVAVLTDDRVTWQPGPYESRGFGLGIRYDYHVLKLRDPQLSAAARARPENPCPARAGLDRPPGDAAARGGRGGRDPNRLAVIARTALSR